MQCGFFQCLAEFNGYQSSPLFADFHRDGRFCPLPKCKIDITIKLVVYYFLIMSLLLIRERIIICQEIETNIYAEE